MNKKEFLALFGKDHLFSAYDYKKDMPPIGNITDLGELRKLNRKGYCVFFSVNSMKNKKRNNKNTKAIRAIWVDDDNTLDDNGNLRTKPRKQFPLRPSIIVSTSPGKYQYYWLTDTDNFEEFELVMQTMIDKHGNDKSARDLARVLRVPGYNHMKDLDNPHRVKVVGGTYKKYDWEIIKTAFPPAEFVKSSTKEKGKYNKKKAKKAIKKADDYHGSLRDRAMELANRKLDTDEIIAILEQDMNRVPEKDRDKRWQDRISYEHLYECADSAVRKYEGEGHEDGDEYEIAHVIESNSHIAAPRLPRKIIAPENTVIGELTNALYKTWWIPNIMVAGLAARSVVAYFAGGKYRSDLGDRINIQQIAIGETGCGKDLMFNQFGTIIDQVFKTKEENKKMSIGVIDEVGSAEGVDLKLRTCGNKHDAILLQDEIGGLMQTAKRDTRKREILDMLLKFYTKSDATVSERALVKKLPPEAAEILYAPHIILSGATTPKLITQGLDSTFLSYGSASRMIFFPVGQYVEKQLRRKEDLKLSQDLCKRLHRIAQQKNRGIFKYPVARVKNPVNVEFSEDSIDLCYEIGVKNRNKKGTEAEIWNRHIANAKKYAMIDAIAEDPRSPKVTKKIMQRNLRMVAHACEYSYELFASEVGESEQDIAKKKIMTLMNKYATNNRVVRLSDINNIRSMKALRANERYSLLKEMEEGGEIVKIEKDNHRGKATITFKLG